MSRKKRLPLLDANGVRTRAMTAAYILKNCLTDDLTGRGKNGKPSYSVPESGNAVGDKTFGPVCGD